MALAAGSTIAGNLFILGVASNVIIIQRAEKKAGETLGFWEFARVGAPLTLVNALVYWLFLQGFISTLQGRRRSCPARYGTDGRIPENSG